MPVTTRWLRRAFGVPAAAVVVAVAALLGPAAVPAVAYQPATGPNCWSVGYDPEQGVALHVPMEFTYPTAQRVLLLPAPPPRSSPQRSQFDDYLARLGPEDQYAVGSTARFWARWRDRVRRNPRLDFQDYRTRYVRGHARWSGGESFESFMAGRLLLDPARGWRLDERLDDVPGAYPGQRPDAFHPDEPCVYEFKFGYRDRLRAKELRQLRAYVRIAVLNQKAVGYYFAQQPHERVLTQIRETVEDELARLGLPRSRRGSIVQARVFRATGTPQPVPDDPRAPPAPALARPAPTAPVGPGGPAGGNAAAPPAVPVDGMMASGQYPAGGGLSQALALTPATAAEAALAAEGAAEFAAEFGDEDDVAAGQLGGVDFSTLELRYVSDVYRGAGAQFAFRADATLEGQPSYGAERAARIASDAFFVWLALPVDAFTVNLDPDAPDRIIDERFGRTDAGRILLEADLRMKRTTVNLINPRTPLGRVFWDSLRGDGKCLSMRQWIVPAPATVRETDRELFILDAPLEVRMETERHRTGDGAAANCREDPEAGTHNERLYRERVLPLVEEAINSSPEYADLRRVYYSRVAAQWYRDRSAHKPTAYSALVDTGDVGRWLSAEPWSPREVYDRFLKSYTEGEYSFTHRSMRGDTVVVATYLVGGVDFTRTAHAPVAGAVFAGGWPTLARSVQASRHDVVGERDGAAFWLGGMTTTRPLTEIRTVAPAPASANPVFWTLAGAVAAGWLFSGVWLFGRYVRRRAAAAHRHEAGP
ncbi:hypothetical protein ABNF97_11695 [Plantactinospora sp. B6F1]|uniref:hypothetical protein n=1 Tax=Plantactinospora sp. B6F1 TaxID=3158971 RepID=UPI0032D8CD52